MTEETDPRLTAVPDAPAAETDEQQGARFHLIRPLFIELLKECPNVRSAARAVKFDVSGLYRWKRNDPTFAAEWAEAIEINVEDARAECFRRGVQGYKETVTDSDGKVITSKEMFSDKLLLAFLGAHDKRFSDKMTLDGTLNTNVTGSGENGAVLVEHAATAGISNIMRQLAGAKASA